MKLPKKHKSFTKRPLILVAVAIVVVAAAIGGYYLYKQSHKPKDQTQSTDQQGKISYAPPTNDEKKAGEDIKKQNIEQQTNPPTSSSLSLSISRAGQSASGQPVSVRMIVNGTTTGQCKLTFTMSNQTFTKSADVAISATYYICQADIPASDFPANGNWSLSAYVTNGQVSSPSVNWIGNPINVQK